MAHERNDVDRGTRQMQRIYQAAGIPDRFASSFGTAGHRFYAHLMWPFIMNALAA